ncbi:dihydrodipicolinate synthase family protein [Actinophytocola gossypii]|uniref:Dihydrodipicolinate synthase family protein n=1 Tax=Actinophytocola gossypii TaxID=2812003 RepID=A0ABT2J1U9_9PSEU|nr:dihydrodipicolinate synthase family protein [Actinophytocola gossypii]MCT2581842.1 dihydrodipicolinate synthase family protein [Actinophytocola gossypii]
MATPLDRGLWGILATPFLDGRVDDASLRREVELFTSIPAAGIVALGVFGEGASLDSAEQRHVVATVVEAAGGLPVVAGVSALRTAPVVEQARTAVDAAGGRLAALMVQANSPKADVLTAHLRAVHDATGAGIVLQDYPVSSGVTVPTPVLLDVVAACPFVVAVKAESPPVSAAIAAIAPHVAVPVFGGLGGVGLLDELAVGAAGAMTGFSRPEALAAAIGAWDTGGMPAAEAAFARWLPLANFEAQAGIGLALRKEALRLRGIFTSSEVRAPAPAMPDALRPVLDMHLANLTEETA